MSKPLTTILRDGRLYRSDGARWSFILGDWVLPFHRQKGVLYERPASLGPVNLKRPETSKFNVREQNYLYKGMRVMLAEAQNWRCCYCGIRLGFMKGEMFPTIEHVVPRSKGGGNDWLNLVVACGPCNHERSSMEIEKFMQQKGY